MIDLTSVSDRLKKKNPGLDVDSAESEYRSFLAEIASSKEETAPSAQADIFWHEHMLDTRKYATDCQIMFGTFLHHLPRGDYCSGSV